MKVICKECGEQFDDSVSFCPYCGIPLEKGSNKFPDTRDKKNTFDTKYTPLIAGICFLSLVAILGCFFWVLRQYHSVTDAASATSPAANDTVSSMAATVNSVSSTANNAAELTAKTSLTMPNDIDNYHKVSFSSGDASSVLERVNDLYHYEPGRACDNDPVTSWQEGNKNSDGQNEWLELHLEESRPIKYIALCLGNWRDISRYEGNNRPTEMRITLGGTSFTVQFADVMERQYITFSEPVETDSIRFTITDVVVGTNGDHDCCISEVTAYSA